MQLQPTAPLGEVVLYRHGYARDILTPSSHLGRQLRGSGSALRQCCIDLLLQFQEDERLRENLAAVAALHANPAALFCALRAHFCRVTGEHFPALTRRLTNETLYDHNKPGSPVRPYVFSLGEIVECEGIPAQNGLVMGAAWLLPLKRLAGEHKWVRNFIRLCALSYNVLNHRAGFLESDELDLYYSDWAESGVQETVNRIRHKYEEQQDKGIRHGDTAVPVADYEAAGRIAALDTWWNHSGINQWSGRSLLHTLDKGAPQHLYWHSRRARLDKRIFGPDAKLTVPRLRHLLARLPKRRSPLLQQAVAWAEQVLALWDLVESGQRFTVDDFDNYEGPEYADSVHGDGYFDLDEEANEDETEEERNERRHEMLYEEGGWRNQQFATHSYGVLLSGNPDFIQTEAVYDCFEAASCGGRNGTQGFVHHRWLRPNHSAGPMGPPMPQFPRRLTEAMTAANELEKACTQWLIATVSPKRRLAEPSFIGNCLFSAR